MLRAKTFHGTKAGRFAAGRSRKVFQSAVDAATDWMNAHAEPVHVRHVAAGQDEMASTIVVWYEEREGGPPVQSPPECERARCGRENP